jgi:hypothetical protein
LSAVELMACRRFALLIRGHPLEATVAARSKEWFERLFDS